MNREEDDIDKINHEALYDDHLEDYPDEMPDLEDSDSVNTSLYDPQAATPASTAISTDMEAAGGMLNLSMGPLQLPVTQATSDSVGPAGKSLSDDEQFSDMFKVPAKVPIKALAPQDPPPLPQLDPWALMAEAKFKSSCRPLPPPPGLRRQHVMDTRNVVLQSMQTPKASNSPIEVADPRNRDPLYLDRDASRDKALQTMEERRRRESRSSCAGSRLSSGKRHRSGSRSRDKTGPKRGQQMPTEVRNSPGPMARIVAPTLD